MAGRKTALALSMCGAALLGGCGIAAKVQTRNDMQSSLATYKACLAQNPSDPTPCRGAKEAYEADLTAYRATSAGLLPGTNSTVNVNTEAR